MQSNLQKTQPQKQQQQQQQQQQLEIINPSTIFVGVDFAAALLGEELSTVYNKSSSGRLPFPSYKIGGSVKFKYVEVMAWVENLQPTPARPRKPSKTSDNLAKRGRGRPPKRLPVIDTQLANGVSL